MSNKLLLFSIHQEDPEELLCRHKENIADFLAGVPLLLYIPYATNEDWDLDTQKVRMFFNSLGIAVIGIHQIPDERITTDFEAVVAGDGAIEKLLYELEARQQTEAVQMLVRTGKAKYIGIGAGAFFSERGTIGATRQ